MNGFEKWARLKGIDLARRPDGMYKHHDAQIAEEAYREAIRNFQKEFQPRYEAAVEILMKNGLMSQFTEAIKAITF